MYTVRWKQSALDHLADLWLKAANREAINAAVLEIDRVFSVNPHEAGESRTDNVRVFFCQPIGVFAFIDESRNVVEVLRVWTF